MNQLNALRQFEGKAVKITYLSGASVYASSVRIVPEEGSPEFMVCGPSDIVTSSGEGIGHPTECYLPLGALLKIKENLKKVEAEEGKIAIEHQFNITE